MTANDEKISPSGAVRLRGSLGAGAIVFMVVAAAAPLTTIGGAAPLGILLGNGVGFPSMYLVSGVVLLLFSVGLARMSRSVPKPGAFFTYIGYGLGRPLGLGAAWLALLTYTTIQLSVYCYIGFSMNLYATTLLGLPSVPWWAYALALVAVTGYLGYRNIELSSKVLGVALLAEIGITIALSVAVIARGGAQGLSGSPFTPSSVLSGSPGVGLMFAFAGFIGFEATAIFRDEARDPERTIPRATYASVLLIGLFYAFAGWALVMAWGPSRVVTAAGTDTGGMIYKTAHTYLGTIGADAIQTLLLSSMFACILSFHNVLTRYQHVMGGVGVLPPALSRVHLRHASPHVSSVVQTVTAALLVTIVAVLGLDPVLQGFTWMSAVATIAVIVLMLLTSVAVVAYFRRNPVPGGDVWRSQLAPLLATVGLAGVSATVVAYFPTLVGGGWGLSLGLLALVPGFLAIGIAQTLHLRRRTPAAYAGLIDAISA